MRKRPGYLAAGLFALLMALQPIAVAAAEIAAFISIGVQSAVEELIPVFEKASGHRIVAAWAVAAGLNTRVQDGEVADVLISTRAGIDALIKAGKISAGSDVELARSGIGLAVRKGAQKPDVSTPEALKRTLLAARAISYSDPAVGGASGVHFASVLERLGIAAEMKARTRFPPPNGLAGRLLVSGEADLSIQQIPEVAGVEGIELIGPLPGDLQLITTFVAGIPTTVRQGDAARAFVRFLQSPQAVAVMKAKGLEVSDQRR